MIEFERKLATFIYLLNAYVADRVEELFVTKRKAAKMLKTKGSNSL